MIVLITTETYFSLLAVIGTRWLPQITLSRRVFHKNDDMLPSRLHSKIHAAGNFTSLCKNPKGSIISREGDNSSQVYLFVTPKEFMDKRSCEKMFPILHVTNKSMAIDGFSYPSSCGLVLHCSLSAYFYKPYRALTTFEAWEFVFI